MWANTRCPNVQLTLLISIQSIAMNRLVGSDRRKLKQGMSSAKVITLANKGTSDGKKYIYKLGEPGSGTRPRGKIQDFYKIRDKCLKDGVLFEDPVFPAEDASVYFSKRPDYQYDWKRPGEIVNHPKFFLDGVERSDIRQGALGDCWMLSSIADLTMKDPLFYHVVPKDQSFNKKYAGIFHFRFWKYGRWIDVVVDDRLMVQRGTNQLLYLHCVQKNDYGEFWTALLEKAYAKMCGSYECLDGGVPIYALEDFTGGFGELFRLDINPPPNIFDIMLTAYQTDALISCARYFPPGKSPEGLVGGHAYSVTAVAEIELNVKKFANKVNMIRLRNPWGQFEWNGPWGDNSPEWNSVPESKKKEIGLVKEEDGEFWMNFDDFMTRFHEVDICYPNIPTTLGSDQDRDDNEKFKWHMSAFEGAWREGVTSGGLIVEGKVAETAGKNPQYLLTLEEPDDKDGNCTLLVNLLQKDRREFQKVAGGVTAQVIALIFCLENPDQTPRPLNQMSINRLISTSNQPLLFSNAREKTYRHHMPPGTYCIMLCTADTSTTGEYVLRVLTRNSHRLEEYDKTVKIVDPAEEPAEKPDAEPDEISDEEPKPDEKFDEETETEVIVIPAGEDQAMDMFFKAAGNDFELDWKKLKKALDSCLKKGFPLKEFSKDVCRSLVAMMDVDLSGKLNLAEFLTLYSLISKWKDSFLKYDVDGSGNINASELDSAFKDAGIFLNGPILNILVTRYGDDGKMAFDDFLQCAIKLKVGIDKFMIMQMTGNTTLNMVKWIMDFLYS